MKSFGHLIAPELVGKMAKVGGGGLLIKLGSTAFSFLLVVLLARFLSPSGYGIYTYILTIALLLTIPALFGFPRMIVRETAKLQLENRWDDILNIWNWAALTSVIISLAIATMAFVIVWKWFNAFLDSYFQAFIYGMILVPLMTVLKINGAAIQGLRRVILGQLPDDIIRPALLIIFVLGLYLFSGQSLTPDIVMGTHVCVVTLACIVGVFLLKASCPPGLEKSTGPRLYRTKERLLAAWPLALIAGMQQINASADILILGLLRDVEEVGVYRISVQGALFVAFGLQVVGTIAAPYFARLHSTNHSRLQWLVSLCSWVSILLAIPLLIVYGVWGEEIISILVGEGYEGSWGPLLTLSLGQLVNGLFGPVAILLNMTGHDKDAVVGMLTATIVNILFNVLLIPDYGMQGAAIATAFSLAIWNVILWISAKRNLNINCLPTWRGRAPSKRGVS